MDIQMEHMNGMTTAEEIRKLDGEVVIIFITSLASYAIKGYLNYSSLETPFTTIVEADIFNIRTIVYFGGVAILYAYHLQICDTHVLREISALQNVLDMQYANYQQSQESIDMVNRKYHDLKHQIAVPRAEIGTRQKLDVVVVSFDSGGITQPPGPRSG